MDSLIYAVTLDNSSTGVRHCDSPTLVLGKRVWLDSNSSYQKWEHYYMWSEPEDSESLKGWPPEFGLLSDGHGCFEEVQAEQTNDRFSWIREKISHSGYLASFALLWPVTFIATVAWALPIYVAYFRRHRNLTPIAILEVLVGCSCVDHLWSEKYQWWHFPKEYLSWVLAAYLLCLMWAFIHFKAGERRPS
jgi:hypothetical protein